jgi:pimeloyl-ACP methyl ester carboxylesterase
MSVSWRHVTQPPPREDPGHNGLAMGTPRPFAIAVRDHILEDLRARLGQTRWPPVLHDGAWKLGTNRAYLERLVDYWRDGFDWRAQEARLNAHPQFDVEIEGANLHFVHLARRDAPAVLLLHGWPYTFAELLDLADRIAGEFEVVVPSLPGYIFSGVPPRPFFWRDVPRLLVELMETLGHERFVSHGSDIGAQLTSRLAVEFPERLLGVHLTHTSVADPGDAPLTDAERAMLAEDERWEREDAAYTYVHETRPATLSFALTDSPVGLAAWIVEKLHEWTDLEPDGDLERVWERNRILTLLTLYWTTGSIATSFLSYYETAQDPQPRPWHPTEVPAAFAIFGQDLSPPPREWAQRGYRHIVRWTESERGGHFPAIETVDLLADEIRAAVATFVDIARERPVS